MAPTRGGHGSTKPWAFMETAQGPSGESCWSTTGTMGPMAPPLGEMQPREAHGPGREINGYPFTTFTDFSDFLGIIPRVSSDDLAYYVDFH